MAIWRVILSVNNRPFALMSLEPGTGLTEPDPPEGLVAHVETLLGPFDDTGPVSAGEFRGLAYRDLQWPPPRL